MLKNIRIILASRVSFLNKHKKKLHLILIGFYATKMCADDSWREKA